MKYHEAANIFPLDEDHLDELAKDIKEHGQQVAIETLDGDIIDGRRRYQACVRANVTPSFRAVKVSDPVAYVLSLNLHRRHLAPAQLAMVAAKAREIYDVAAKERQKRKPTNSVVENLPQQKVDAGKARDAVGKAIGVSGKSVDYATKVLRQGTPQLVKAVEDGRVAISTAAILATEPPEKQIEEITKPTRNRRYVAGEGTVGSRNVIEEDEPQQEIAGGKTKLVGVGVICAHEAINSLIRIPKNDALRKRGFQIVTDWIKHNS